MKNLIIRAITGELFVIVLVGAILFNRYSLLILFTVITTVTSLISFLFAGIRPIRWIGGISAGIVFMVYLYVIILIPILMSFGKNTKPDPTQVKTAGATKADILFEFFGRKVCRHSGIIAAISAAIMLLQIPGVMNIDVNMDYTKTMGEKIPFVTRLMDMLSGKLGSLYDFNVMVEFNESDALKNPANMKRIEALEQKLGTLQLTKISGDTSSQKFQATSPACNPSRDS